jgi:hypothetical protein
MFVTYLAHYMKVIRKKIAGIKEEFLWTGTAPTKDMAEEMLLLMFDSGFEPNQISIEGITQEQSIQLVDRIRDIKTVVREHFIIVDPIEPVHILEQEQQQPSVSRQEQESKYLQVLQGIFDNIGHRRIKMTRLSSDAAAKGCHNSKFLGKALRELNIITYSERETSWKWISPDMPNPEMAALLVNKLAIINKDHQPFKVFVEPSAFVKSSPVIPNPGKRKVRLKTIQRTIDVINFIMKSPRPVTMSEIRTATNLESNYHLSFDSVAYLIRKGLVHKTGDDTFTPLVKSENLDIVVRKYELKEKKKKEARPQKNIRIKGELVEGLLPYQVVTELSKNISPMDAEELAKKLSADPHAIGIVLAALCKSDHAVRVSRGMYTANHKGTSKPADINVPRHISLATRVLEYINDRPGYPMRALDIAQQLELNEKTNQIWPTISSLMKAGKISRVGSGTYASLGTPATEIPKKQKRYYLPSDTIIKVKQHKAEDKHSPAADKLAELERDLQAQRDKTKDLEQKAKDLRDYIALGKKLGL